MKKMPGAILSFEDAIKIVRSERKYQRHGLSTSSSGAERPRSVRAELDTLRGLLRDMDQSLYKESPQYDDDPSSVPLSVMKLMRKMAACTVRCIEYHGAPEKLTPWSLGRDDA